MRPTLFIPKTEVGQAGRTVLRPASVFGFILGAGLLAAALPVAGAAAELRPVDLRCEYAVNPVGVDAPQPRLFWKLESTRRGARQTAYQVRAATTAARLEAGEADLWDSGKVESPATGHIRYAGRPLASSRQVFWQVRVWDGQGAASPWSDVACWITGVMTAADWQAGWISAGDGRVTPGRGLPLFRNRFVVEKPVARAVVHVCGLGQFDLFLDGHKVGDHFLDPAWSVYEKTVYYTTFDLTGALARPGEHIFGVMLGKGFYHTAGDRRVHGVRANRPLKLILQARLFFADGTERVIASDASWKTAEGPITHSAILGGEDHDARKLPPGWAEPAFDDSAWTPARETAGPGGAMRAALAPPMKAHEVFPPVRVDEPQPGVFVYDFGQNASAVPRLRVRGQAGQQVKLTPAEQRHGMTPRRNDGRGPVNQAGVGRPNYFEYTLRSGGAEIWTPQFSYSGFQYLQVEGAVPAGHPNPEGKPVVEALASLHVRNAAPVAGRFACSHPLFNRIDRLVDWAVRSNLGHVLTDCPHREKLGWLEVAYLMGPSIAGRYDLARFYAKVARDIADSQRGDGLVPTVAPAYPKFEGGFAYTPEWGAAAVVVPWQLYEWYGDREALEAGLPTMRRLADFMERTAQDLVPLAGLGDWYDYGHGKPVGASQFTPPELTAMATFYRCAEIVARAEETLQRFGHPEDPGHYDRLSDRIAGAFERRWFNGANGLKHAGSPQTANAMALCLGLGKQSPAYPHLLDQIVADIRARGNQQTAGDIGHWYLLQTLARNGRSDVIFDLTARTNLGGYSFIVNNGWTSMPEAWDADTGASMNHCMLGHIQEWFLGWVAGIRLEPVPSPRGAAFLIEPWPVGDLTWARGEWESLPGRIVSEWRTEAGRFRSDVTVPANAVALVRLPARADDRVLESGRPIAQVSEIRHLGPAAHGRQEYLVEGGDYRFEVVPR
jgi:hypothetical protein